MKNNFFFFFFRMKYINRWVLMRSNFNESLSTHSMETAVIAHALASIGNNCFGKNYDVNLIGMKALYHDAPEILTGDLPTPVKYYNEDIKNSYKKVENAAVEKLFSMLPNELFSDYTSLFELSDDEKRIIKSADKLCAYIKCIEEKQSSNREFDIAYETIKDSVDKMCESVEELKYFCDNFLEGFCLPLDTIGNI